MRWKPLLGGLCILGLCILVFLFFEYKNSPRSKFKSIKAIYFCVDKKYFTNPMENLDKYYSVTDRKEITHLAKCLLLHGSWELMYGYRTQAKATNHIVFIEDNNIYLEGDFIESNGNLRFRTHKPLDSEFKITDEADKLIRKYLKKAEDFSMEK